MTKLLRMTAVAAAFSGLAALSAPALAQDVTGTWLRENGESRVRFAKCGEAMCGTVVWLKNPAESKSKVGQRVFYDMVASGANAWTGKAFNPEDGKTYSGKMTLSGNSLTTAGCVAGGWICRSANWSRSN
ncbi:MAG: DUF2147 domain-containing protein [Rhizobiales bacterium]|nr:DUF2147 domain-containing protein [Hyphomicrobiales bacterium]